MADFSGKVQLSVPGPSDSLKSSRKVNGLRVMIAGDLVQKLVTLGVPNDTKTVGRAVNQITRYGLDRGTAYLPDGTDALVLKQALVNRTGELARVNLELLESLTALRQTLSRNDQLQALEDLSNPK